MIAPKVGVHFTQLGRLIKGVKPMTLDEFALICEALNVDPMRVLEATERSLKEQADELKAQSNVLRFPATSRQKNQPADVIDFPHTQEENLPDFTKLAARKVTNRPEWEKRQALDGIGEENQDPVDY